MLFGRECDEESVADGMTEAFPRINLVYLSSYKLPKTRPATTLLLFGQVALLCGLKCGTFLFYLLSEGSV